MTIKSLYSDTARSVEYKLEPTLRLLILGLMDELHYDFNVCEQCNGYIPDSKFQIHHTKYDGATFLDLQVVCQKCNLRAENRYLA